MSTLQNDFARFTIVNLEPDSPSRGPFIVTQNGSVPGDPRVRNKIHLLARDGTWVDMAVLFTDPAGMAADLLFETVTEMLAVIEKLAGPAVVRPIKINPEQSLAEIERIEASGGLRAAIRTMIEARHQAGNKSHD
ncbi:MAG: hypothetical protein ACKO2G_05855 [Verrucomicrobiales bacterium]